MEKISKSIGSISGLRSIKQEFPNKNGHVETFYIKKDKYTTRAVTVVYRRKRRKIDS